MTSPQDAIGLLSMTGFTRHEFVGKCYEFVYEIKSLNNRFFEASLRLPPMLSLYELEIKSTLKSALARGRVDLSVKIENRAGAAELEFSEDVFRDECVLFKKAQDILGIPVAIDAGALIRLIDKARVSSVVPDEVSHQDVYLDFQAGLRETLNILTQVRRREGGKLEADIKTRLGEIALSHGQVTKRIGIFQKERFETLKKKISELLSGSMIDESRIIQEVALLNERSDISEELTRVTAHLDECTRVIAQEETPGKKLDFLCQELHREWNTISSKSQDGEITKHSIAAKSEIEKMREQVQNVV